MITNNSLKEYYVKLQELYENATNLLTGINQSLTTTASEITVPIVKDNYTESEVRIPSFLYLENKLEELSLNYSNLMNMPDSGDAWLSSDNSLFKLSMIRANTAPVSPELPNDITYASITDNNFLKDLVSPKTFLKVNISNLPIGCESVMMKKMVMYSGDMYSAIERNGYTSYEEIKAALYNFNKGTDYDEYDSELKLPCRRDRYRSRFIINEVLDSYTDASTSKVNYKVTLDTFTYFDKDDSSITFSLKTGDILALGNTSSLYKLKNIDTSSMEAILEEYVGHTPLMPYNENQNMVFQIYNANYSEYDYIQVPLEENRYIIVFLASIYNNVQSTWSDGKFYDLAHIYIKDAGGNYIQDEYGNNLSYLDYYEKYCTNIGDLILGLTQSAYPQVSNFSPGNLESIQDGNEVKTLVDSSWDNEETLQVVPINKHLTDDNTAEDIINLNSQKNDINAQLSTNQANIDQVYNKLLNTDFSNEITITQTGLQEELNKYYTERTTLQKQLNSVIDAINTKSVDVPKNSSDTKYRVRGVTDPSLLISWLHDNISAKVDIVGMDIEYKYKSPIKDTNSVTSINQSLFTDWVRINNIQRDRKLVFGKNGTQGFGIEFVDYTSTNNVVKWNQIDIPIKQGEDVVIRIRYKYNIGQPFINLYTPWSDELVMVFPSMYNDNVELRTILSDNENDTIKSSFSKTLIDEGYEEHVHNKLITNEQTFYHLPENIYSGFNTPENNLISLKDKLLDINSNIEKWRTLIDNETNSKFELYINYDEISVQLSPNGLNKINIYNTDHISNSFIKKEMNLIIKNTGNVRLNLYSIFPGNQDIQLLNSDIEFYNDRITNYERVPIYINNNLAGQYLGQWIYFRTNNPYTRQSIFYETSKQNQLDLVAINSFNKNSNTSPLVYQINPESYMLSDVGSSTGKQVMLGYRNRKGSQNYSGDGTGSGLLWGVIYKDKDGNLRLNDPSDIELTNTIEENVYNRVKNYNDTWFIYREDNSNMFITRYEDIVGIRTGVPSNVDNRVFLDANTNLETFTNLYRPINFKDVDNYIGAFLYPNIMSKETLLTEGGNEKDSKYIEVGESLTIPITFEFFANDKKPKVSRSIYFDIRNSLISDPKHFMVEVIGHNEYSASNDIYTNQQNNTRQDDASDPSMS